MERWLGGWLGGRMDVWGVGRASPGGPRRRRSGGRPGTPPAAPAVGRGLKRATKHRTVKGAFQIYANIKFGKKSLQTKGAKYKPGKYE